ncbi:N-acetylmuramoyl-L-alanine amidase [bacterium]|nr:N-acetylmuramoyl-L-alanine amidase [candidate division CSSED10-310 bacterium]
MTFRICLGLITISSLLLPADLSAKSVSRKIDSATAFVFMNREIYLEIWFETNSEIEKKLNSHTRISRSQIDRYRRKQGEAFNRTVYRIPFDQLNCSGKRKAVKALFPDDTLTVNGWVHRITHTGSGGETLWRISTWFTGSPGQASRIQKANDLDPKRLYKGTKITIPYAALSPCFQWESALPVTHGDLIFNEDKEGVYAEYVLKYKQTIYTDVVIRFTALINAPEVMEASGIILGRSGLKSFHDIPADTRLKIPIDMILPEYLPAEHPLRIQHESTLKATRKYKKTVKTKALEGITIVLDSGHGGVDPGTVGIGTEKEDEYAFDVLCRAKILLAETTKATVYPTISDEETSYAPRNQNLLDSGNNREYIQTHPPYWIENANIGLNMRWYLSNYLFEQACKIKNSDDRIVFTSFHADCLHPNLNGLMVYIPGADYYDGNCRKTESVYTRRREIKGRTSVRQSREDRLKAESLSNSLARRIIESSRKKGVPVHRNNPIRKYVVRKHRTWVPAVLQYSRIPTRVLIELVNLQNESDRRNIRNPDYRQTLAQMYVDALLSYFENTRR